MKKSEAQNKFYQAAIAVAFELPEGTTFIFNNLKEHIYCSCCTKDQQEAGRRFAYFVKHATNVPFVIIGKNSSGNLVYRKTGPNPMRHKSNWKGGGF